MSIPESFLVIVECMTFNHHSYIEDAMNGFCIQKTDFPYLCVVMDDCSTDGEQEVIKKYVTDHFNSITNEETDDYILNLCQHKTIGNCYFAVFYLKYNHYSIKKTKVPYYSKWQDTCKYIAMCEGDDYWIDERKLQMQVEFLEGNKEYVLVYTKSKILNNLTGKIRNANNRSHTGILTKKLIKHGNFIPTLSVLHRNCEDDFIKEYAAIPFPLYMGDKPKWLIYSTYGKFKCLNQRMVMYRILEESASHSKDKEKIMSFWNNGEQITKYFNRTYNVGLKEKEIEKKYRISKILALSQFSKREFFKQWIKLIADYPFQIFNIFIVIKALYH